MEPGFHGALGDAEERGDGWNGQVGLVAQHDRDPLVRTKDLQGVAELLGALDSPEPARDRCRRTVVSSPDAGPDLDGPDTPPSPEPVPTGVDQDPPEPRIESRGIAKVAPPTPGLLRGVMHRVLGLESVAEDDCGPSIGPIQRGADQQSKGGGTIHGLLGQARDQRLDDVRPPRHGAGGQVDPLILLTIQPP